MKAFLGLFLSEALKVSTLTICNFYQSNSKMLKTTGFPPYLLQQIKIKIGLHVSNLQRIVWRSLKKLSFKKTYF